VLDFRARNVKSIEEYKVKIKSSFCNFSYLQKWNIIMKIISIHTKLIIHYLKNKYQKQNQNQNLPIIKFLNTKWKIGCFQGKGYENGYPHTRGDTIFLPKNQYISKNLLVHEKVHILQKKFPQLTDNYIKDNNFVRSSNTYSSKRANPDIDQYTYYNKDNKIEYSAKYKNQNPKNIGDVHYAYDSSQRYEHPFEQMAIDIASNLYK
tara:strand:- start:8374 stop:8991 length:618 start_codon:yes stop_codon:yes gene_type:complete